MPASLLQRLGQGNLRLIEVATSSRKEKNMNRINGTMLVVVGLVLLDGTAPAQSKDQTVPIDDTRSPRFFGRPAMAQSNNQTVALDKSESGQSSCKEAKGNFPEFWGGGGESPGTISNGGWLNGTTLAVFTSAGFPTPVPTQFTYTAAFTITTGQGLLKGTRTFLTDVGTGWAVDMTIIDPNASTGRFAGATGVLYVYQIKRNTDPAPTTYHSVIVGLVCFAGGMEPRDR
jgi:hypothetical protein